VGNGRASTIPHHTPTLARNASTTQKQRTSDLARKPQPRESEGKRPLVLDAVKFALICEELARTGSKYKSCEALGFSYTTVRDAIVAQTQRGEDSWQGAWDDAYDQYRDSLEVEATRRARDGAPTEWKIMRNERGEAVRVPVKVEYSDRLMEVLLKGAFPERFRERISIAGTIGLEPVDAFANLTAKAKREIRAIVLRDLEEQRSAADAARQGEVVDAEFTDVDGALEDLRGQTEEEE